MGPIYWISPDYILRDTLEGESWGLIELGFTSQPGVQLFSGADIENGRVLSIWTIYVVLSFPSRHPDRGAAGRDGQRLELEQRDWGQTLGLKLSERSKGEVQKHLLCKLVDLSIKWMDGVLRIH